MSFAKFNTSKIYQDTVRNLNKKEIGLKLRIISNVKLWFKLLTVQMVVHYLSIKGNDMVEDYVFEKYFYKIDNNHTSTKNCFNINTFVLVFINRLNWLKAVIIINKISNVFIFYETFIFPFTSKQTNKGLSTFYAYFLCSKLFPPKWFVTIGVYVRVPGWKN